jgi:molybdate transport system permease protein
MDWSALRLSLQVGVSSTALALVVGLPLAWLLARKRFRGRQLASALVLLPMLLPPTVLGYYLLQIVGRGSFVGGTLDDLFGFSPVFHWTGATLAAFVVSAPFLIRSAQAGFESVDRQLEEAARASGGSGLSVFLHVTVPLAWPSLAAGVAMALARAMGEFGATLLVAGSVPGQTRTMPIAIYEAVLAGRTDDAQVLALTLSLVTMGIIVAIGTLTKERRW